MGCVNGAKAKPENTKNKFCKNALDALMDDRGGKKLTVDKSVKITGRTVFTARGTRSSGGFNTPARMYDQFLDLMYRHDPQTSMQNI